MADHRQICPDEVVPCPACEMTVARRDLASHQQDPRLMVTHMMAMQQTIDKLNRRLASVTRADRDKLVQSLRSVSSIQETSPSSPLGLAMIIISGGQVWEDLRGQQITTDVAVLGLLKFLSSHHEDIGEGCESLVFASIDAIDRMIERSKDSEEKQSEDPRNALVAAGAFDALMGFLAAFHGDRAIQYLSWSLTLRLLQGREEDKTPLKCGLCERLMALLEGFVSDRELQVLGCRVLSCLRFDDNETYKAAETLGPCACRAVTAVLAAFPTDRQVQASGCEALSRLALQKAYQPLLGQVGACSMMVSAVKAFVKDPEVQLLGFMAIANLAMDENNKCRLAEAGACQTIVAGLRACLGPRILEIACVAAKKIVVDNKECTSVLSSLGACEAIIRAFGAFPADEPVQIQGCKVIEILAVSEDYKKRLLDLDLCRSLVAGLRKCRSAFTRCKVIALHAHCDWKSKDALGESGACRLVMDALLASPNDEKLQLVGCESISALVDSHFESLNSVRLVGMGLWRALITALRTFPHNEDMLKNVCSATASSAWSRACKTNTPEESDVCEVIMRSLKGVPSTSPVQNSGCWAIASLARLSADNCRRLANAGACHFVVSAMTTAQDDKDRQQFCFAAIACLGLSYEIKKLFGNLGACGSVLKAMRNFPGSVPLQLLGCSAIESLVLDSEPNRTALTEGKACQAVISAMSTHSTDGPIQRSACYAIAQLAANIENREVLGEVGACGLVIDAARQYSRSSELQLLVCLSVKLLAEGNGSNRRKFHETGACQVVVAALEAFHNDPQIVQFAFGAIAGLAKSSENRTSLGEAGACAAVAKYLEMPSRTPNLLFSGCLAVYRLAIGHKENKLKLMEAGVLDTMKAAIISWPQEGSVQQQAKMAREVLTQEVSRS